MFHNDLAAGRGPRLAMKVSTPLAIVYTECSMVVVRAPRASKRCFQISWEASDFPHLASSLLRLVRWRPPKGSVWRAVGLKGAASSQTYFASLQG